MSQQGESSAPFESWCILELMGHRRLGGFLREREIAGHGFLQIDIYPGDEAEYVTQMIAPTAVYAITPTTEEVAREIGRQAEAPIGRWELRRLLPDTTSTVPVIVEEQEYEPAF